jgi:uncharacterized protein (UPF0305 family)
MKDIAEQLAFVALVEVLEDGFGYTFEDNEKKEMRRYFAERFEHLLTNLPEDAFADSEYPDYVEVEPVHPDQIRFGLAFRVTFKDWPRRHYMAKDADEIEALIAKYDAGEIKE